MAREDAGERTEQPTARRLQEAHEEGRVPRSADLTAAVGLLGGLMLLKTFGPSMMATFMDVTRSLGNVPDPSAADIGPFLQRTILRVTQVLGPLLAALVLLGIAGSAMQSRPVLTWKKLQPDWGRINPLSGFKRIFSSEAVMRLVMGLFKIGLLGAVAYFTIRGEITRLIGATSLHPAGAFAAGSAVVFTLAVRMGLLLLVLGLLDYFFQRWKLMQSLRMTKQEVRDELKRMEGDPMVKQRRRQVQQKLAMQRIAQDVPQADVVVTNPTEYAVALKYDEETMAAPRVLAKGKDFLALRIRQVATGAGVPVVQRPPLARALYAGVDVGGEVPADYYKAVAEVLAYVYQLSGRTAQSA